MEKQKKLEQLTMKDNFMFGAVMCDPRNCKPFLEMILDISIGNLTVSAEKSLVYHPEYKGVRLDVEASDEKKTRYNIELQVINRPFLEHRTRYYHSQIDMDLLRAGSSYGNLPDAYVIFICDFDPFGLKKYRYTFQNVCREENNLLLRDGLTTMFLSTRGENRDEVPRELIRFLEYVGSDLPESQEDFGDAYVRQLQEAVRQVKANREMEAKYMTLEEMLQDEREAGMAEGQAASVLYQLQELSGEVPKSLQERILSEKDNDVLKRYLRMVLKSGSVEEFMNLIS